MAEHTQVCTYPPGTILCHEGEFEDSFYVVAEGTVVISKKMLNEEGQHILRVGGRGDLVGEMGLIQNAPRAATVRCLTDCTLLEMGKQDFEAILGRSPRMAMDIIRITLDRLRANDHMAVAELKRTNSVLRQLDRNKLEFIQVAAHELRTPLTVLSGYAEILRSFPEVRSNTRLEETIDRMMSGAERIQEVVNMMLDVTRIDSELLTIGSEPVPVRLLVGDVVHGFMEATRQRSIRLMEDYQDNTPDIFGDIALIQKAIYHLIVNAIKYTPDGGSVPERDPINCNPPQSVLIEELTQQIPQETWCVPAQRKLKSQTSSKASSATRGKCSVSTNKQPNVLTLAQFQALTPSIQMSMHDTECYCDECCAQTGRVPPPLPHNCYCKCDKCDPSYWESQSSSKSNSKRAHRQSPVANSYHASANNPSS